MTTRISEETRTRIAVAWPQILRAIADGDLIKDVLGAAGISRHELNAYKSGNARLVAEWDAAREASADSFMDQALEEALADKTQFEAAHVRTRIDTLKWAARIRNPRAYGEKQQLDVNVKTVDLTRIIEAANARVQAAQVARVIPHNSEADRAHVRALPALLAPAVADLL